MGSILYSGAARPRRKKRFLTLACERRLFPSSLGFCVILRSATRASLGLFSSQACDNAVHAGQRSAAQSECVAPACGLECGRRFEASERCAREAQEYEAESRNPCISERNHFFLPTSCDAAILRHRPECAVTTITKVRLSDFVGTALPFDDITMLAMRRTSSWLDAVHLGCPQCTTLDGRTCYPIKISGVRVESIHGECPQPATRPESLGRHEKRPRLGCSFSAVAQPKLIAGCPDSSGYAHDS
jgi:hypothetical protein